MFIPISHHSNKKYNVSEPEKSRQTKFSILTKLKLCHFILNKSWRLNMVSLQEEEKRLMWHIQSNTTICLLFRNSYSKTLPFLSYCMLNVLHWPLQYYTNTWPCADYIKLGARVDDTLDNKAFSLNFFFVQLVGGALQFGTFPQFLRLLLPSVLISPLILHNTKFAGYEVHTLYYFSYDINIA